MGKTGMEGASVLMQRSCRTQKRGFKLLPSISEAIGHRARRGFNLIEAAIVLGVVGLVVAGIWIAAASIKHRIMVNKTVDGMVQIVFDLNRILPKIDAINGQFVGDLTSAAVGPTDFRGPGGLYDPWGNYIGVNPTASTFDIAIFGINKKACVDYALKITTIFADDLISFYTDSGFFYAGTFPISLTQAVTACDLDANIVHIYVSRDSL